MHFLLCESLCNNFTAEIRKELHRETQSISLSRLNVETHCCMRLYDKYFMKSKLTNETTLQNHYPNSYQP
jgi:hypothetical protein